jgi:hypothetical protein
MEIRHLGVTASQTSALSLIFSRKEQLLSMIARSLRTSRLVRAGIPRVQKNQMTDKGLAAPVQRHCMLIIVTYHSSCPSLSALPSQITAPPTRNLLISVDGSSTYPESISWIKDFARPLLRVTCPFHVAPAETLSIKS